MKNFIRLFFACLLFPVLTNAQIVNPNDPSRPPFGRQDTVKKTPEQGEGGLKDFYSRKDSVKKFYAKSIRFAEPRQFDLDTIAYSRLDTSITDYQNYSLFYSNNNYYLNVGNLGLASKNMYQQFGSKLGFATGQSALSLYEFKPERVNYYRVYSPYTEVTWVSGFGSESLIDFIHTQNIKPNLNIGFQYSSIGSEGYYPRQRPKHNLFSAWSWYQSRNLKYNILGNVIFNSLKAPENGGLSNDSIFTVPTNKQHEFESIYLNDALTTWNNSSVYLKQSYVIGARDTNAVTQAKVFKSPFSKITNSIQFDQREYKFDYNYVPYNESSLQGDVLTPSQYFSHIYIDSLQARDRVKEKRFRTDLDISLFGRGRNERFNLGGGIAFESVNYNQHALDSVFSNNTQTGFQDSVYLSKSINNALLKGRVGFSLAANIDLDIRGQYVFAGFNSGDVLLDGTATVSLSEKVGKIILKAVIQNSETPTIYNQYSSNFHRWSNSFSKINSNLLSFTYSNSVTRTRLSAQYNLINNYAYFGKVGNEIIPQQSGKLINILRLSADQLFKFGMFRLASHFTYQANNAQEIIPAPDFYTYQSFYYQNKLFKVLDFQIGFDARYYTKFKSMGYAPELGQFYVAEGTREVGNYPIVDVFLTAGLRRTRFLIKYDYWNQGLNKKGYYTVDKYAMPDAQFKFGLSWRFYD
ncbi:putative porin [Solitalea lacus]|uniref:putative porin n=1 Tax=Solitalea lacus TaxID=2911172 RepID=UPI001EDA9B44|nr:putative porin [Solitalea lacus]UKJ07053.1 putative porin [Solitalea lacus]